MDRSGRIEIFNHYKYGFFAHYVWGASAYHVTMKQDGTFPESLEELVRGFDVRTFTEDMVSFGVQYVVITAFHANMNLLFPCEAMDKWLPGHTSKRDLIGEIIYALKKHNISVILYIHPRDGHDLTDREMKSTGWGYGKVTSDNSQDPNFNTFNYKKWNDFINDVLDFITEKYGKNILGFMLDEASMGESEKVVDYVRLKETIHNRNDKLILIQNFYGSIYNLDLPLKEYTHTEEFQTIDGNVWPCFEGTITSVIGSEFWPKVAKGINPVKFSAESLYRFIVLQISANHLGGGVLWAAGPYCNFGWEDGVKETMLKIWEYLRPVREAIIDARPSKAYPTKERSTINMLEWGVATCSQDGNKEYLHFLIRPEQKSITIQPPQGDKLFKSARLLPTGNKVGLIQNDVGITLTLGENDEWDEMNTIIEMSI